MRHLPARLLLGTEVGDGALENEPLRRRHRVGVHRVLVAAEAVGESVVFALADPIELLGMVRIGTILAGKEAALVVPVEAEGIAQPAREDLGLGFVVLRVEAEDAGGERRLAVLVELVVLARFSVIGPRADAEMDQPVGARRRSPRDDRRPDNSKACPARARGGRRRGRAPAVPCRTARWSRCRSTPPRRCAARGPARSSPSLGGTLIPRARASSSPSPDRSARGLRGGKGRRGGRSSDGRRCASGGDRRAPSS